MAHTADYEELKTQYFGLIEEIEEIVNNIDETEQISNLKYILKKARKL